MTETPDYHRATNAAYQLLQEMFQKYFLLRFKTDVLFILEQLSNVCLLSYSDACVKYNRNRSTLLSVSDHGFTIRQNYGNGLRYIVLFNDWKDDEILRFTLAHEIGHIILNHTEDNDIANKEANCFARNLLCPVYVRSVLDLNSREDYCSVFNVSKPMAEVTLDNSSLDFYHVEKQIYRDLCDALELSIYGSELMDLFRTEYATTG